MTFLKRTLLYLTRKKGKTMILFLLILIVSFFVLSCFSILYATGETAANMRTAVGAAFHIRSSRSIYFQETSTTEKAEAVITERAVQQIMENGNIKYYNGRNSGYAKGLQFIPGAYHTDENSMGQVSANSYSALHPHFTDHVLELTNGRHITPDDTNVVLVSETLAALNGLSVGDTVSLAPAKLAQEGENFVDELRDTKATTEAEVVGIFRELEPQGDSTFQPTAGLRSNLIFSDHGLLVEMEQAKEGEYAGGASFYIQDPLYLNTVVDEVQQTDLIDWDCFFIRKDNFHYEKISAGLQTIQSLITTLLVCVSIVSAVVLFLILIMRMRGRVHEAGIFLSIGISKQQIIGQFIAEVTGIAMIAFVCAYFSAGIIAGQVENRILENMQVEQIDTQALETGLANSYSSERSLAMPIGMTFFIYACILTVTVVSVCLSAFAIIKLKPREILAKHE